MSIDLDYYDRETEIAICAARSGLLAPQCAKIVDVVREYRDSGDYDQAPTVRAAIMTALVAARLHLQPSPSDERFVRVLLDMLQSKIALTRQARERRAQQHEVLRGLIEKHCDGRAPTMADVDHAMLDAEAPIADVGQPASSTEGAGQ